MFHEHQLNISERIVYDIVCTTPSCKSLCFVVELRTFFVLTAFENLLQHIYEQPLIYIDERYGMLRNDH